MTAAVERQPEFNQRISNKNLDFECGADTRLILTAYGCLPLIHQYLAHEKPHAQRPVQPRQSGSDLLRIKELRDLSFAKPFA